MSSNFIVFPFRAVSGLFFSSLERQREKTRRNGAKGRTEAGGGWQGVRESAVSCQTALDLWFGTKPAQSETPSEPRPSGVHPEEGEVGERRRSLPLENDGLSLRIGSQHTASTHGDPQLRARCIFGLTDSQSFGTFAISWRHHQSACPRPSVTSCFGCGCSQYALGIGSQRHRFAIGGHARSARTAVESRDRHHARQNHQ